jgi:hypothetical protein
MVAIQSYRNMSYLMEQQEKHDTWCDKSVIEQLVVTYKLTENT